MDLLLSGDGAPLKSNILVRYDSEQQRDGTNKVASDSVISVSSSSGSTTSEMNTKLLNLTSPTPTPRCKVSHWLDLCSSGEMYQRPQLGVDGVPFAADERLYPSLDFIEDEAKRTASILFRQDFEKDEKLECDGVRPEPKQVSEVRKSCDSMGSNSKQPKHKPTNAEMPLSPESRKKNELCSYLKLMDLKHREPKNGNVLKNRRSTRVKNLMMLSEKKELEKKMSERPDNEEITSEYSKYSFEELNMDVRVKMEETNDSYWLRQNFRPEFVPADILAKVTDFEDSMDDILSESDRKRRSLASNKENRTKSPADDVERSTKKRQSMKWLRMKKMRAARMLKAKEKSAKVKNDPLAGRLLRSMAMRKLRSRPKLGFRNAVVLKKKYKKVEKEKVDNEKGKDEGGKDRRPKSKEAENKGKEKSDTETSNPALQLTNGPNIVILTPQELSKTIVTEESPPDNESVIRKEAEKADPVLTNPEPTIAPDVNIIPQEPPPEVTNEENLLRDEIIRSPPKEQKSAIQYKEHVQKEQKGHTPDAPSTKEQSDGDVLKYSCPTPLADHNYSLDPMYMDVHGVKRKKPHKHRRINLRGFSETVLKHKSVRIETGESSDEGTECSSESDDSPESEDETPAVVDKKDSVERSKVECNGATVAAPEPDAEDALPVMNERHLIPVQRNAMKSLHRNLVQNRRRESKRLDAANGSDQDTLALSPRNSSAARDQKRSSHSIAISIREGPIVDCHYFDYNLVVTQDRLISFWNQSPLGSVLDSQEMWIPRGCIRRLALDKGCVFKKSRETVISGENSFAYVELWTKEHKSDRRERPVADVFAVVYFWKNRLTAPEKKFLQLENINGFADDVRYVVLKNTPSILVSWRSMKEETPISMVHCYHLAADFQTISSVRELESVEHVVSSLHNIEDCDTLAIGYGEQKITIWNLEDGYVVATIDISSEDSPEMRNVWVKCDRGFLFLLQHYPGGLFKLLAINGMNHSWKKLQIFRPPSLRFDRLHGVCIDSGILTSFYSNGILCWNIQTGSLIMEETCKETRYLPSGKHIVTIMNNNQVRVKNSLSYLITNYDFS